MMKGYRTKIEIYYDMLMLAREPISKARIIGLTDIRFDNGNNYISKLLDSGLIEHKDGKYIITQKGYIYLKAKDDLNNMLT